MAHALRPLVLEWAIRAVCVLWSFCYCFVFKYVDGQKQSKNGQRLKKDVALSLKPSKFVACSCLLIAGFWFCCDKILICEESAFHYFRLFLLWHIGLMEKALYFSATTTVHPIQRDKKKEKGNGINAGRLCRCANDSFGMLSVRCLLQGSCRSSRDGALWND